MAVLTVPLGLGQILSLLQSGGVSQYVQLEDFVAPATAISYTPADPAAWLPFVPTEVAGSLDRLIALMNTKMSAIISTSYGAGAGTHVWSPNMLWAIVIGTGPGGGGGGAVTNGGSGIVAAGGGGGAGGTFIAVPPKGLVGVDSAYVVGAGGAGGAVGANGNPGSAATTLEALYSAGPGTAGAGANSTTAVSNTASAGGGSTTVGAFGLLAMAGGTAEGGSAQGNTPAVACWGTSGRGGTSFWGSGGVARRQNQQSLTVDFDQGGGNASSTIPGGGGGGALCFTSTTGGAGGNGSDGRLVILEFVA